MPPNRRRPFKSRWTALLVAVGLFALVQLCRSHKLDHDMFHGMSLAEVLLDEGQLPSTDRWSYVETLGVIVHHEWVLGVVLHGLHSAAGEVGIGLLQLLIAVGVVYACWRSSAVRRAAPVCFAVISPFVIPMIWASSNAVRAQTITLWFTALTWYFVGLDRRGNRAWALAFLPFMVLWQNVHGGFVVGWIVLSMYVAERTLNDVLHRIPIAQIASAHRHLYGLMLLALPATCMNPYGYGYISYLWHALRMPRPMITEWMPLWYSPNQSAALIALWTVGVLLVAVVARHGLARWSELLFLVLAAGMSLLHMRHMSLFGIGILALVPAMATKVKFFKGIAVDARKHAGLVHRVSLAASLGFVVLLVCMRCWQPPKSQYIPERLANYMEAHNLSGRVFTPFESGAYLAWHSSPELTVSLDGRYEVAYPVKQANRRIACFLAAPGWQETLREDAADWLVVPRDSALAVALAKSHYMQGLWSPMYEDDCFVLCQRTPDRSAPDLATSHVSSSPFGSN